MALTGGQIVEEEHCLDIFECHATHKVEVSCAGLFFKAQLKVGKVFKFFSQHEKNVRILKKKKIHLATTNRYFVCHYIQGISHFQN